MEPKENMESKPHPTDPWSNVAKFGAYDPDKYTFDVVNNTVKVNEALTPGRPPCLTQQSIGLYLQPLTRELVELPPRPTIDEFTDAIKDRMTLKDKAFWVDKPGVNDYALHEAFYNYGFSNAIVRPVHQDVFPRSYQYDLDCVKYRRQHACDGLKETEGVKKPLRAHCRDCKKIHVPGLTPFQLAWAKDPGQRRWKYYPDLTKNLSFEEIREMMDEVGRPYKNEACNWYYQNYPPVKYDCIVRKCSK